jgi:Tfp pilus assembly protein PilZ
MPKESNRRIHPRARVSIPGAVYLKDEPSKKYDAEILDLSIGGAFVHCTAPILLGQEILLEIFFDKARMLNVSARVIQATVRQLDKQASVVRWVRGSSKSGFGVQFVQLNAGNSKALQAIVKELTAQA